MDLKKSWNGAFGCTSIYHANHSACKGLEVDMLHLDQDMEYTYFEKDKEIALIILTGVCTVKGDGFCYEKIGGRKTVFDGKATAVYVPRGRKFTVRGVDEVTICAAKCPAAADYEPVLVKPEDIVVKHLGKPGFRREAHFIVDERLKANKIYVGENFIQGGEWSSFPGHKHDTEDMPNEGFAEEIYYYRYDKKTGFGIQRVYTGDKSIDDAYVTYENDFVEIPKGYHPCTVAPGYTGYLLWLMCCEHRGFYMTIDPDHAWENQ